MKIVFGFFLLLLCFSGVTAQAPADSIPAKPVGFPIIAKDTLFYLNTGIGPYSAEQRAEQINKKITDYLANEGLFADSIHIEK